MSTPKHAWLLLAVLLAFGLTAREGVMLITDLWWFESIGYGAIYRKILLAGGLLLLIGGGSAALLLGLCARLALRSARVSPRASHAILRLSPLRAADGVVALLSLSAGLNAARAWPSLLLFWYGGRFDWRDPVYGYDAGFYVFDLELLTMTAHWLAMVIAAALLVSGAMLVAVGTVRISLVQQDGQLTPVGVVLPPAARHQLALLTALLLVALSASSFLARYTAMAEPSGLLSGPSYADLHGMMPLRLVEAASGLAAAALVLAAGRLASLRWLGSALLVLVVSRGATVTLPGLLQRVVVAPSELSRERPLIAHHIEATRHAWGLEGILETPLTGAELLTQEIVAEQQATLENIRLWDHRPLKDALDQVQEIRTYYGFVSVDDDRYTIDGRLRQTLLSPRELTTDALAEAARTWINETTVYTHGYGVVLSPAGEVTSQGLPQLLVWNVPPEVSHEVLRIDRPEIYFGEASARASVVGATEPEFDHPSGDNNVFARYQGGDGVRLGRFGRWLFAARLGSTEILLSDQLTSDSRALLYRDVVSRAQRITPFLQYDKDPLLVIADGRLVWILDALTHSSRFPYSASVPGIGNYARDAIKVTIDAYDGTTTFWRTETPEPIADAWQRAFPSLFRPLSEMSPSLRSHLRASADLFSAQSSLLATYHVKDPQAFYQREDLWEIPSTIPSISLSNTSGSSSSTSSISSSDEQQMAASFAVTRLPGETHEEFVLMIPFSPVGKPTLSAWMVARCDGAERGQLRIYTYPKDSVVYGPKRVAARILQDDAINEKLSLWNQQGSTVEFGDLTVTPVDGALLYVQPLYLRAAHGSIPELKRVIVAYGERIAMAETLASGLGKLFGTPNPEAPQEPSLPGTTLPQVTTVELIGRAKGHWDAAQTAMKKGDWMQYGIHTQMLGEALSALEAGVAAQR